MSLEYWKIKLKKSSSSKKYDQMMSTDNDNFIDNHVLMHVCTCKIKADKIY